MNELPAFATSTYSSHAFDPAALAVAAQAPGLLEQRLVADFFAKQQEKAPTNHPPKIIQENPMTARIVRVFIVDPNENLPLANRVIYKSDEQLTDLTDQELFFEANPSTLLAKHNELRTKTVDKKASERANKDVFLEPARIRDLKMHVVVVAAF